MYKKSLIDPSWRILAIPFIVIVLSIGFFAALVKAGYPSIKRNLSDIEDLKKSRNTLSARVSVLREFGSGVLADKNDLVYTAFPDRNPASYAVSQMREAISGIGGQITDIKSSLTVKLEDGIEKSEITYSFESADLSTILRTMSDLDNYAPVSTITEVSIKEIGGGKYSVEATVPTYWALLPTGLPSLDQPVNDLTIEDVELLSKILQYKFPTFVNLAPDGANSDRQNPFN